MHTHNLTPIIDVIEPYLSKDWPSAKVVCYFFITCLFLSPSIGFSAEKQKPCSSEAHQQFSFWQGNWTAFSAEGKKQGTNHILMMMNGCVMQENWNSGKFSGTSFNFYDPTTALWHQTWVDNSGGHLLLSGKLVGSAMVLSGTNNQIDGTITTNRISWTPLEDGRVRQHWQSTSDGETWTEVFDGYYEKNEPQ